MVNHRSRIPWRRRARGSSVPPKDPLSGVPPSRHPFQFWVLFAMALSGAANLLSPGSEILQEGLNPFMHKVWAATLCAGALIALVSAWWRDRATGLLLERIGLVTMGLSCPIYAVVVAILLDTPASAVLGVTLTASVGVAALWRAQHVTRELRRMREFMDRNYR